ncbi:hypothetical protein ABEX69_09115 [Bacillus safensis]|nr:hypothetical protein [Bacillus safensis]MEC3750156.1 hypothetical protein [Bacillus safensis]MEC3784941.1 hypothetical protein [Bacillus safensis]
MKPYGMFVVEMFLPYHELPKEPIKKQSVYQVLEGHIHLSY